MESNKPTSAVFLSGLLVASVMLTGAPARAQLQDIISAIGFGRDREAIDYHERAPLVVPPSNVLRAPEQKTAAAQDAKWPNDPDVARKKQEAADARKPAPAVGGNGMDKGNLVPVDELRAQRSAPQTIGKYGEVITTSVDSRGWMNPTLVRDQGSEFLSKTKEPPLNPGQEPKRKYLTDPPVGVRAAAAGAPVVASKDMSLPKGAKQDQASPYVFLKPEKTEE